MKGRRGKQPIEYSILLTATLCLLAFGAIMVYSASSATSLLGGAHDSTIYLKRYLIFAGIGLVVMRLLSGRGLQLVKNAGPLLLAISFAMLVAVLVPGIGMVANGASRWLGTGLVQVQPSELVKLALVIYAASLLAARPGQIKTLKGIVSPLLLVVGAACLLIVLQPDLGTTVVIALTITAMLVVAGARLTHLGVIVGAGFFLVLVASLAEPYRRERLLAFINPWSDAGGSGFQSVQAMIALGSGGLFGVGLGESVQKVFYLPEAHTDMILAVIGEELGLVGVLGILFLFGLIAYAGLRAAKNAPNRFQKLLGAGIVSLILAQATVNFFAVLGLAPLTGVPLPFISYGGSNLIVLLSGMGLLLNIAAKQSVAVTKKRGPIGIVKDGKVKPKTVTKRKGKQARKKETGRHAARGGYSGRRYSGARGAGDRRRRRSA